VITTTRAMSAVGKLIVLNVLCSAGERTRNSERCMWHRLLHWLSSYHNSCCCCCCCAVDSEASNVPPQVLVKISCKITTFRLVALPGKRLFFYADVSRGDACSLGGGGRCYFAVSPGHRPPMGFCTHRLSLGIINNLLVGV